MKALLFLINFIILFQTSICQENLTFSVDPPEVPIGEDAYLHWDKLPYQKIGVRAYMRSTYDRDGNNRGADASHFLYQESDTFNVTLDIKGNGILYFVRTNHFHGSPWHYEVDGHDFIVKETATDDPIDAKNKYVHTEFIPQELFPNPLTWTWSNTKGADLMWRPISFANSFRLAYERTFYGTGYYIYHLFPKGISHLSQPVVSWKKEKPDKKVLQLIERSGTDIAPKGKNVSVLNTKFTLEANEKIKLFNIADRPSMVRAIKFKVPRDKDYDFGKCRLTITWDNRWHPSVDVPIDLFYGVGQLHNDNNREYLVKGFPLSVRYDDDYVFLDCYWPMPFFRNASIELQNTRFETIENIECEVKYEPYKDPINHVAYFHATFSNHKKPVFGQDITFLDTRNVEGGGEWSGHFVGMSWIFSEKGNLSVLEGDPRFFFDDSQTPQAWGTGSEEWGGGGDYWGGENMTIPFAGHPVGKSKDKAKNEKELINSAYRFLIADYFPFGKRAVINIEHGGNNTSKEHYKGVVYWYGIDAASLVLTDEVNVCDKFDIEKHNYSSPTSGKPYALVSRFELGPDGETENRFDPWYDKNKIFGTKMLFPAQKDSVRTMNGISQFTVELKPENLGVLLRRKFDYGYPNQHAKIYVREFGTKNWHYAGDWYTAGSNTCVYSRPEGKSFSDSEMAPTEHNVITSNRRWREEEFLIARKLTENINKLVIKIEHVGNNVELYPGMSFPEKSVWSESRYKIYCYVMPVFEINDVE